MSLQGGGGAPLPVGLSDDGQEGINVTGALTAGIASRDNPDTALSFHGLYGNTVLQSGTADLLDGDPTLITYQVGLLTTDSHLAVIRIGRRVERNGHVFTTGALTVEAGTNFDESVPDNEKVIEGINGTSTTFTVNAAGGIGTFGKVPATAPRTLAQATINAIADANAKTAVQACANALVDMGVLTLT